MGEAPNITPGDERTEYDSDVAVVINLEASGRLRAQRAILSAEEFWFGGVAVRSSEWNGGIGQGPNEEP